MPAKFTLRPGVFFEWIDAGLSPISISTSIGCLVFPSDRGSLEPAIITGYDRFQNMYGLNKYERGYGHDTARAFFRTAEAAMGLRVTGTGAKYAFAQLANDYIVHPTLSGAYLGESTTLTPLGGSDEDYLTTNRDSVDIVFGNTDIAANQSFTVSVNTTTTAAVTISATHNTTMDAIAASIQTVLDGIAPGGKAFAVSRKNSNSTSKRIIRVISPQNITLTITAAAWTGSAAGSAPTLAIRDTEWLQYIVTENPGAWGNNVAIKFDGLDKGRLAKTRILFNGPLAANHNFSYTINGLSATVPVNAGGSNAMLDAIAASINSTVPDITASVVAVTGSNLNREIILTGNNNKTSIIVGGAAVGFGSGSTPALPTTTVTTIVTPIDTGDNFTTTVYEYPDLRNPVESWRGTFQQQLDATGNQINLEYLINKGPSRSTRIRSYVNPAAIQNSWTIVGETVIDYFTKDGFMSGGANGALPTSSDMVNGWNKFRDPVKYTVRLLMDCGYATPEVHRNMNMVCEERRDCIAILGTPAQYQASIDTCIEYRQSILAVDSSYSCLYSSDVQILDVDAGIKRWSPPSGYVGATFAFTDRTRREFWSNAGLNRGRIPEADDVRLSPDNGGQGFLAQYQINAILNYKRRGIYIFGDWTLQYKPSPFQYVGTRRMCNSIEVIASETVAYSLFEPNTRATRNAVIRISEAILQDYQDGGGIERFKVTDETTKSDIDSRSARFAYIIDPVTSIHQIHITGIVINRQTNFEEIIQSRQGNGTTSSISV